MSVFLPKPVPRTEKDEALEQLRKWLKAGDTVHTILKHVSSSGMSRAIDVKLIVCEDGKPRVLNIAWHVGKVLGYPMHKKHEGLKVGGAGMDMGFHLVYSLSRAVFADDYKCTGAGCLSNDHTNDRDGSWSREKNVGRKHSDSGYALRHEWL